MGVGHIILYIQKNYLCYHALKNTIYFITNTGFHFILTFNYIHSIWLSAYIQNHIIQIKIYCAKRLDST